MTPEGTTGATDGVHTVGSRTDETFSELSILEDVDHEKVPNIQEDEYHHRYVEGDCIVDWVSGSRPFSEE